jgi:hypothetical protein
MTRRVLAILRAFGTLMLGILGGAISFAVLRSSNPPPADPVREIDSHAVDRLATRKIDAVDYDHVRLADLFASFSKSQNLTIVCPNLGIDNPALDSLVMLHLRHVTLAQALDQIVAAADSRHELGWLDHDGVITIAPQKELDATGPMLIRIYDVGGLLGQLEKNAARFPPLSIANSGTFVPYPLVPGTTSTSTDTDQADVLMKLLTDHVAAEAWIVNGGTGNMSYLNGKLVVRQTESVHLQIQQVLQSLLRDH